MTSINDLIEKTEERMMAAVEAIEKTQATIIKICSAFIFFPPMTEQ